MSKVDLLSYLLGKALEYEEYCYECAQAGNSEEENWALGKRWAYYDAYERLLQAEGVTA